MLLTADEARIKTKYKTIERLIEQAIDQERFEVLHDGELHEDVRRKLIDNGYKIFYRVGPNMPTVISWEEEGGKT